MAHLPSETLSSQSEEEGAEVPRHHPAGKRPLAAVVMPTLGLAPMCKPVDLQHKETRAEMPDLLQPGEALAVVVARPNLDKTDKGLSAGTVVWDGKSHSPVNRSSMALEVAAETIHQQAARALDEAEMARVMVPSAGMAATH